jgi:hypothetical protein
LWKQPSVQDDDHPVSETEREELQQTPNRFDVGSGTPGSGLPPNMFEE